MIAPLIVGIVGLEIPFPNIDPVALQLGPFAIKWYGLAYLAGCCSAGSTSAAS